MRMHDSAMVANPLSAISRRLGCYSLLKMEMKPKQDSCKALD
jgi:hypothetical protein